MAEQQSYSFLLINFHPTNEHDAMVLEEREKYDQESDQVFLTRYQRYVSKYGEMHYCM